jgi:hypothetical protein
VHAARALCARVACIAEKVCRARAELEAGSLVVVNDSICRARAGVKVLGASRVVVQRRGSAVVCSASPVSTAKLVVQGVLRNVVEVLEERGLIESMTSEELRAACTKQWLKVYCGFDPTAELLHLGNLLGIIVVFLILVLAGGAIEFQCE